MPAELRCLFVADGLIYQEPVAARLACLPGLMVVGTASCAASAIKQCSVLAPDLLLLDLAASEDGLVVVCAFLLLNPQGKVIMIGGYPSSFLLPVDLRDKVIAFVERSRSFQDLLAAISPLLPYQSSATQPPALERLTAREHEVLLQIGKGLSSQAIADQLGIQVRTVDTHRYNIAIKLGVRGHSLVHMASVLAQTGQLS